MTFSIADLRFQRAAKKININETNFFGSDPPLLSIRLDFPAVDTKPTHGQIKGTINPFRL